MAAAIAKQGVTVAATAMRPAASLSLRQPRFWSLRWRLMVAASVTALMAAMRPAAAGGPIGMYVAPSGVAAAAAAQTTAAAAAASAAAAGAKQAQSMSAALQALQNAKQNQNIAHGTFLLNMPGNLGADPNNPGRQLPNVADGLGPGGLVPDPNLNNDPTLWQGASLPVQFNDGGPRHGQHPAEQFQGGPELADLQHRRQDHVEFHSKRHRLGRAQPGVTGRLQPEPDPRSDERAGQRLRHQPERHHLRRRCPGQSAQPGCVDAGCRRLRHDPCAARPVFSVHRHRKPGRRRGSRLHDKRERVFPRP